MTAQYAIVAFPVLAAAAAIESIRGRFDPLASMLRAHITLVFPFTDVVSEAELAHHLADSVKDQGAFDIALSHITIEDGGYVFLNVENGSGILHSLHARLYDGLLASHLSSARGYRPHVTIGRQADTKHAAAAAEEARLHLPPPIGGRISEIALFRLDETDRGDVVLTVGLSSDLTVEHPG